MCHADQCAVVCRGNTGGEFCGLIRLFESGRGLCSENWDLFRTRALRQSVRLVFEYTTLRYTHTTRESRNQRMLESIVELLGGLLLSAPLLLIGSCIVGSIVAALRAVSGGS